MSAELRARIDAAYNRLMSDDPDFDDCTEAAAVLTLCRAELQGPDGFDTWKDAAIAARLEKRP